MSALGLGAAATSNAMGGHRGHGFALGQVHFQLPSQNVPVMPLRTGARTLTPERFRKGGIQHGNAEQGKRDGERDRDRGQRSLAQDAMMGVVSQTVGDPTAQATAYRVTPTGPQEAAEWRQALENVMNRLSSIEAAQRKNVEISRTHDKRITDNHSRCQWLHTHCNNMTNDLNKHDFRWSCGARCAIQRSRDQGCSEGRSN